MTRLGKTEGAAEITWALRPSGQSLVGSDDFAGQGTQDYLQGNGGLPNGAIGFADGETSKTFQVII